MRVSDARRRDIWNLCKDVADNISITYASTEYKRWTAMLLFGTAAQESGLWHRRQVGFNAYHDSAGAFGLWQTESISILDSMRRLDTRPMLNDSVMSWLFTEWNWQVSWLSDMTTDLVCKSIIADDRMACLFARLHYLWKPNRIPVTVVGQAQMWKRDYNTIRGSGTVDEYVNNYNVLCRDIVDSDTWGLH